MYEDFFGLHQRPFTLVPNAEDFVGVAPMQDALDSLVHCITQSRGIAVLTSAPGLGKTMLCRRLMKLLEQDYRSIYLSAAGIESRLSLLQGILFELNMGYVGLTDQEARLKLLEAARAAKAQRRGFLLIIDEAQGLTPRLFEEIRALTEYAPEGEILIPAILCGSFELEEKLADPGLISFNQRIGLQICLTPLSLTDSARFISDRFKACGAANVLTILDEEALDLICRASDGNPHCLSQLTDHACLLAFADGQQPVSRNLVRRALEDLKELPLRWSEVPGEAAHQEAASGWHANKISESSQADQPSQTSPRLASTEQETDEFPIPEFLRIRENSSTADTDDNIMLPTDETIAEIDLAPTPPAVTGPEEKSPEFAVFEVGAGIDSSPVESSENESESANHLFEAETIPLFEMPRPHSVPSPSGLKQPTPLTEIPVIDRYTLLDRLLELPEERHTASDLERLRTMPRETAAMTAPESHVPAPVLPKSESQAWERLSTGVHEQSRSASGEISEEDVLELVQQIRQDLKHHADAGQQQGRIDQSHTVQSIPISPPRNVSAPAGKPAAAPLEPASEPSADAESGPHRRFEQLFTRLRLRRRKIESEHPQR